MKLLPILGNNSLIWSCCLIIISLISLLSLSSLIIKSLVNVSWLFALVVAFALFIVLLLFELSILFPLVMLFSFSIKAHFFLWAYNPCLLLYFFPQLHTISFMFAFKFADFSPIFVKTMSTFVLFWCFAVLICLL